jgi:RNA polymerase sigma factor (sigma-70 family)
MAAIQRAVSSLPCDQSAIIRYRLFQQLDFDEIGQRMGRSESAVRSLWGRAVKRLRVGLRNAV